MVVGHSTEGKASDLTLFCLWQNMPSQISILKRILASSLIVIPGLQHASGKKRCGDCTNYGDHGRC